MATEHTDSPGISQAKVRGPPRASTFSRSHRARSPVLHEHFEVVYGPLIGPASVLLARNLARHVTTAGGAVTICPVKLALELGLRASHDESIGKSSHLVKAIDRLAHHRLAKHLETNTLGVVICVPPLTNRALGEMPGSIQEVYARLLG